MNPLDRTSKQIGLIVFILIILGMTSCGRFWASVDEKVEVDPQQNGSDPTPPPASVHLGFGNPSNATTDPADRNNFLVVGEGSVFSFNNSKGTVNWVSWKTTREDLGPRISRPEFRPDPRLPDGFKRIGYYDYSGSGFDRGHLVPSADRFANVRLNEETFMMTNIVPQTPALNQFPWQKLESYARAQARRGWDVYQIAGVYGEQSLLKNKVVSPTNCWKIIATVPRGKRIDDLDRRMRMVAVDMPNREGIENDQWEKYKVSIRSIEETTGLDLLSHLPREVQDRLETRIELRSP